MQETKRRVENSNLTIWAPLSNAGPGVFFARLLEILDDQGVAVFVITHSTVPQSATTSVARVTVREVHTIRDLAVILLGLLMARHGVVAFHAPSYPPVRWVVLRFLNRIPVIPVIVGSDWFDNVRPELSRGGPLDRAKLHLGDLGYRLFARGSAITVSTAEIVTQFRELYGADDAHTAVIQTALPPQEWQRIPLHEDDGITGDPARLIFVGRLSPENGVAILITALSTIRQEMPRVTLRVLGDGPLLSSLPAEVASQGLADSVQFLGNIDRNGVERCLREATLGVFPFLWRAGAGNAVLEAMALGVPVVVSEANETVRHFSGEGAIRGVPPGNADALSAAVIELLGCPDLRKQLVERARVLLEAEYSPLAVARAWKSVVLRAEDLLAGNPSPSLGGETENGSHPRQ